MKNYLSNEALSEPCFRNLILGPMVGALFLMFLPLIGYFLVMKALLNKVADFFKPVPMVAGEAYLTGHAPSGNLPSLSTDEKLAELAEEIEKRKKLDS